MKSTWGSPQLKTCKQCGDTKDDHELFPWTRNSKDIKQIKYCYSICKKCRSKNNSPDSCVWRKDNREHSNKVNNEWRSKNKDRVNQLRRERYKILKIRKLRKLK